MKILIICATGGTGIELVKPYKDLRTNCICIKQNNIPFFDYEKRIKKNTV
jgi:hypothetical protein